MNTGGVGQPHQHAADDDRVFYRVARRAAYVADDSPLVAEQSVQQGRFAGIGCTYDSHLHALLDSIACLEGGNQAADSLCGGVQQSGQLRAVRKLQFLMVGKIEFEQ